MHQFRSTVDDDLVSLLACPRDNLPIREHGSTLICEADHRYPIVDGVPVFLCEDKPQSLDEAYASLKAAATGSGGPFYLDTIVALSDVARRAIEQDPPGGAKIDPVVSWSVLATSGYAYTSSRGRLKSYPIPDLPLAPAEPDHRLLDVGCNWGRWSLSAARKGWRVVGLDPSLGALMAARRMAAAEGQRLAVVCGDARFLPFRANAFQTVFSYSVLQHFDQADVEIILAEIARVMQVRGIAKIQMAHRYGLRSTYHRARTDYSKSDSFRVRYWKWSELQRVFEEIIGPSIISPEAFGGLGLLHSDRKSVTHLIRIMINISEALKQLTTFVPSLKFLADSVYVESRKCHAVDSQAPREEP
jgi:2-polyprenyl-3-methyl-5-hydroxy-6-metoxy-1,4-benzoquinol methylase/uncharacterized protein YbaR (Trm112 family)